MTDEQDIDEASEAQPEGPVAGQRLAEARRAQQISILDIAKELHLDEHKVRSLEQNDFDDVGAAVFAKGYLRKYAQLVGVEMSDVMADYYSLTDAGSVPLVIPSQPKMKKELSPLPWLVAASLAILSITIYWWIGNKDATPVTTNQVAPLPEIVVDNPDDRAADTAQQEPVEAVEVSENNESLPIEATSNDVNAEPMPNDEVHLAMTFSGDCWTEVTDVNGRRLFFGLATTGRPVDVTGQGPLIVLLGNAEYAALRVNDSPFQIPAASRRGRTAKLTISGT